MEGKQIPSFHSQFQIQDAGLWTEIVVLDGLLWVEYISLLYLEPGREYLNGCDEENVSDDLWLLLVLEFQLVLEHLIGCDVENERFRAGQWSSMVLELQVVLDDVLEHVESV